MIFSHRLEPDHTLEEYIRTPNCIYETDDEEVLCCECGQCKEIAEEQKKTISAIDDYMNSNCEKCSFVKGSQQCENCYVGGY